MAAAYKLAKGPLPSHTRTHSPVASPGCSTTMASLSTTTDQSSLTATIGDHQALCLEQQYRELEELQFNLQSVTQEFVQYQASQKNCNQLTCPLYHSQGSGTGYVCNYLPAQLIQCATSISTTNSSTNHSTRVSDLNHVCVTFIGYT